MSTTDTILSNTVGLWVSAAPTWLGGSGGHSDPWTLNNIAEQQAKDKLQAMGLDPAAKENADILASATEDAKTEARSIASTTPPPKVDCSIDQTEPLAQAYCAIKKIESVLIILAIVLIAGYIGI